MEFVLHFTAISGKENSKTFRNINDVLAYIDKYQIDQIDVHYPDNGASQTYNDMNNFEEDFKQ